MAACVHGWARCWIEQSCSLSLRFDVDEHAEYRKRRLWLNEFASDYIGTCPIGSSDDDSDLFESNVDDRVTVCL